MRWTEPMEGRYAYGNWVLVGLGCYMVLMLLIGWWASRRIEGSSDYLVAGRRLGIFFCTGTLFATWFGSGTCMGGAGNAYLFGNQGVLFDPWGAALCLLLAGFFFARLMRRGQYLTVVDLFEVRYGRIMGVCSAGALSIAEMGWVGAQLVGFGTIIHYFAGIPVEAGIVISTLILIVYTYLGGMWAVTLTDVVQMMIIGAGLVAMLFYALPQAGGWEAVFTNDTANMMGLNRWSFVPTPEPAADPALQNAGYLYYTGYLGWFYWIAAWLALGLGSLPAQDLMQRVLSAKNERVAAYSSYLAAGLYCTLGMIPVVLGMIYFQVNPGLSIDDAMNKILLFMAVDYLHPAFTVLFVAALVSALMSSSDSAILASASIIGYNGYKYFRPEADEAQLLKATRVLVPVVTCLSLILALYFRAIYNLMVIAWSILLVGLVAPYVAACFWKRANQCGAVASFVGGFIVWIGAYFVYLPVTKAANTDVVPGVEGVYFDWAMWDSLYISSVWGLLASIACLVVVSLATRRVDVPKPLRDLAGNELVVTDWKGFFGKGRRP